MTRHTPRPRGGRPLAAAALAALLLAAAPLASAAAEPVFPPGSAIGLEPPPGYTTARAFTGFQSPDGGTVVLAQFPAAAWPEMADGMTPERLAQNGLEDSTRRSLRVAGREGVLIEGRQAARGLTYTRWLAVFPGEGFTGLVTVNLPGHPPSEAGRARVEAALAGLAVRAPDRAAQVAALPFAFRETEELRVQEVVMGSTVLLGEAAGRARKPTLVIAASTGVPPGADRVELAEGALRSLAQYTDLEVERSERARVAGSEGVFTLARANDANGRGPVRLAQWIAFPPGGAGAAIRAIGEAVPEEFDAALPGFRRVVDSLAAR